MATFKAEVQNKRSDGTYNVRIRITHNRNVRRLSTNIYITDADLTRSLKIKNQRVLDQTNDLIKQCREVCNTFGYTIITMPIDLLVEKIKNHLRGGDKFQLNFMEYSRNKTLTMNKGTAGTYINMLNSLQRYTKRDNLDISEVNSSFLRGFEQFIETEPSMRGSNRKTEKTELNTKGERAVSLYLSCLRAMHNKAKEEYNDEDRGIINIPFSPFKNFKIKSQPLTRKRALSARDIQAIIDLPYKPDIIGGKWNRFNLAKDCFILSLALIGMNSADMYSSESVDNGVLIYNRMKTKDRRNDNAEMKVRIEEVILPLIKKYKNPSKTHLFIFHKHYTNNANFNIAINKGLKQIGEVLEIENLTFYAARHSWATLARSSSVGVDKHTVHEALNHADSEMRITDIYIDKDWSLIWDANKRVLDLFDFSTVSMA